MVEMESIFRQGRRGRHLWPLSAPLAGLLLAVALVPLVVVLSAVVFHGAGPAPVLLSGAVYALGIGASLLALRRAYRHRRLGVCNGVTMLRAALVSVIAGAVIVPEVLGRDSVAWMLVAIASVALALDGVDGWAARRAALSSRFGAWFDMEVDVAFACVLAVLVWLSGTVGAWVVAIGLLHPVFVLSGRLWPALRAPLPDARWRKALCVVQMVALIALLVPALPEGLAPPIAATVLALLVAGFGRDALWLVRQGR